VLLVLHGALDSELFQALEEGAFQWISLDPVSRVCSPFVRGALRFEHMIHTHQEAMGHCHKRPFLALTGRQATQPRRQIGRLGR
jgi:hypothetical protein